MPVDVRHATALLCLAWALLPAPAEAARLVLRLRDAGTGLPTAARVVVRGPSEDLLVVPDTSLRTHSSNVVGNYAHAEDSLVIDVPVGFVQVEAVRGLTGIPVAQQLLVDEDLEVVLLLSDWADPAAMGWFGGDPHVHSNHEGGAEYSPATVTDAARAARAEGLHVMALLDNDLAQPGGPVLPPEPGTTLIWGEEYRTGFWGHVVLLGLSNLVLTEGQPGCCGWPGRGWPTLTETLDDPSIPVALLAHPHTTDRLSNSFTWPGAGLAREMRALALGDLLAGVAAVGATNNPPWSTRDYLDALRAGARWAAIGEGDRPLDRYGVGPVGSPRTFARVDPPPVGSWQPGDPDLGDAWISAVAAQRTFATTGPLLHTVTVDGTGMGDTLLLGAPGSVSLRVAFDSYGMIDSLRVYGATGRHLSWGWPTGRAQLDTTVTLNLSHADFVAVEIEGSGDDWPQLEHPPRALSSPVWIDAATAWPLDAGMARRGADVLREVWELSLSERGYDSAADSAAAAADILGAADAYEAMVDDPPPAFVLTGPDEGIQLSTLQFVLEWEAVVSYDGEPVQYRVTIARDPAFTDVVLQTIVGEPSLVVSSLAPDQRYLWQVEALEPGDPPTVATNAPRSFRIEANAVSVPILLPARFALRAMQLGGAIRIELTLPERAQPRVEVMDLRGRRVRTLELPTLPQGVHTVAWDGRDQRGRSVGRGVYWLRGQTSRHEASAKFVLR